MRFLVLGPGDGWHANQLHASAERARCELVFADYETLTGATNREGKHVCGSSAGVLSGVDGVLTRTMPLGTLEQVTFRLSVLHALEDSGLPIVNPPRALELAIDKYATTAKFTSLGLRVPSSFVAQSRGSAMEAFEALGGDVVVKPLFGGEGRGVMRVETSELAWTTFTTLEQLGAVIYQQEFVGSGGRDLRLLGIDEVTWAIERTNLDDWRTNVSRGSKPEAVRVTEAHQEISRLVRDAFDLRIAAIDLIFDEDDAPYLLEVNGVPGWKGAQGVIDDNIADHIIAALMKSAGDV